MILLQLLGTILVAWAIGWVFRRAFEGLRDQKSSLKVPDLSNLETGPVKVYRRGLPELPYGSYRKPKRSGSVVGEEPTEDQASGDLTVLAQITEYFDKAEDLASIGYFEKAIDQLNLALALEPGDAYIYEALGDLYMELVKQQDPVENLEAAISCYRNSVGLNDSLGNAHYKLGVALERRGYKAEALNELQRARVLGVARADLEVLISQLQRG